MTYGPCQDQSSSLPDLGRLALRIISRPTGRLPQVGERTHAKATQTETSPPLHSASPSSTLHHTFTTDLTLVSCGCSKCSIYRSEAGCLEGYCCLAHPLRKEQTGAADAYKRHQCRLFIYLYKSIKLFKGSITHYSYYIFIILGAQIKMLMFYNCGTHTIALYIQYAGVCGVRVCCMCV